MSSLETSKVYFNTNLLEMDKIMYNKTINGMAINWKNVNNKIEHKMKMYFTLLLAQE